MNADPLHLKLQGLWVGAALGELHAKGQLDELPPAGERDLTVREALPRTYRLCLLTARWLKGPGDIDADLWHCTRWQDSLLNVLPLTFMYPAIAESERSANVQPQAASRILAVIRTLEWLQRAEPPEYLLSYLLQTPGLQETALAEQLGAVYRQLSDRSGIPPQISRDSSALEANPDFAIAQVLYLLLSAPEDFRLTLQRSALALPHQPDLQILLAALSGFHNGFSNLPAPWRWTLKTLQWSVATPLEDGLQTLGNLCAARWAGCHTPSPDRDWSVVAVSPPGQLRPR
ncbi:hypothetical protein [Altericista sp. CCNU0014]|uniref:hypothetical protein n=1 Tax=Altericista sp. CCNU0014 TaxID=3082949 RepID=UPI00384DCDB5